MIPLRKLAAAALALLAAPAAAVPTIAPLGDFVGATVIDSNVVQGVEITNQFAAQGISFSGGLFGFAFFIGPPLLPSVGPLPYTANSLLCRAPCPPGNDVTISFASPQVRFGFFAASPPNDNLTVTLFSGATNLGSLVFDTSLSELFIGVADTGGFDRVLLDAEGGRGLFVADGFRFMGIAASPDVPAPPAFALLGLALAGIGMLRRHQAE